MLRRIPEVVSRDELAELRRALDAADWADGRETVGVQGAQVKRNEQLPEASPLRSELGRIVQAALDRNPLFFAAALPQRMLPPRFNRYQGGGTYGLHIDGSVMRLGRSEEHTSEHQSLMRRTDDVLLWKKNTHILKTT